MLACAFNISGKFHTHTHIVDSIIWGVHMRLTFQGDFFLLFYHLKYLEFYLVHACIL